MSSISSMVSAMPTMVPATAMILFNGTAWASVSNLESMRMGINGWSKQVIIIMNITIGIIIATCCVCTIDAQSAPARTIGRVYNIRRYI